MANMMLILKRVQENSHSASTPSQSRKRGRPKAFDYCGDDEMSLLQALGNKPWVQYDTSQHSSEDDSDSEEGGSVTGWSPLPVGVIRGCPTCPGCQKVLARWRPESGCRPVIEDAPVFFPLEEEFEDTIKYIASIRAEAEQYGICRIVPPHSWRPSCSLNDNEKWQNASFRTRVQQLDKLQVRKPKIKKEQKKGKFGRQRDVSSEEDGVFGFEPGPPFTLEGFEKYAHQFKEEYFGRKDVADVNASSSDPSIESIEGEYWRIVENPTAQLEVLYGADIDTGAFGSGFPKRRTGTDPSYYERSGWNLNNIAKLPGSVLSFEEEEISGVVVPWLYVGMCFSSFCWHVEDHHFYSLNYMHFGSPKVWYGVPGNAASKFEEAMKKFLPDLFEEQPDLLHKLVTQLSPSLLKAAGVPVYRAVQRAGEFVVTFPRAYHAGFNCGFNCAEAVNVAPIDWLPYGQIAVELYQQQKRKITVSHDKILLETAKKALKLSSHHGTTDFAAWKEIFSQQHGLLLKVIKERVNMEHQRRAKVEEFVHIRKMERNFDAVDAKECLVCHYDLHLSAVGCECVHERYTCLQHAHELCACDKGRKHAMYRYALAELDALVFALEGNLECQQLLRVFSEQNVQPSERLPVTELKYESYDTIDSCPVTVQVDSLPVSLSADSSSVPLPVDSHTITVLIDSSRVQLPVDSCPGPLPVDSTPVQLPVDLCPVQLPVDSCSVPLPVDSCSVPSPDDSCPVTVLVDSCPESNDFDYDHSTLFLPVSEPALAKDDQRTTIPMPKDSIWSIDVNGLDSFFKDLEASDQIAHNSTPVQDSSKSNEYPVSAQSSEEKQTTQMIVLSDDEDDVPNQPIFNSSSNIDQTNVFSLPTVSSSQGVNWDTSITPTYGNNLSIGPEPLPTYQHVMSHSTPIVGNNICSKGNESNNWALGSHLQESDFSSQKFQIAVNNCKPQNVTKVGNSRGFHSFSSSKPRGYGLQVDLLSVGRLVLHTSWYNSNVIFPAGFRSRVLFPSFLDPCQICFYISEILDCGSAEPLFKVAMEGYSSEVFVHTSIDRCWQLVQERINIAIQLQHDLGRTGLPLPVRPEDIQGLEMFGFSSPHIIKAIESLDWRHQCIDYWRGELSSIELLKGQHKQYVHTANPTSYNEKNSFRVPYFSSQQDPNQTVMGMRGFNANNELWP